MTNKTNHAFLLISAWALIISTFTTLVAHLVNFPTASFEERVLLFQNWGYIVRNDVIILHCILVIVSMLGLGLLEFKNNPGWIGLGFFCFAVFGLAEIVRMTAANVIVNGLREQYYLTESATRKESISFLLENVWPLIGNELFMIFILAFSLGCLCYGIAFIPRRWIGWVLIVWGAVNLFAFANSFLRNGVLESLIEMFSTYYQPVARLVIGIWFLKEVKNLQTHPTACIKRH